jgi:PAS domain S-box-containing protein
LICRGFDAAAALFVIATGVPRCLECGWAKRPPPEEAFPLPQSEPPPLPRATDVAGGHAAPILEASPNAILAVDAAGRILYANARAVDLFGFTRDELVGAGVDTLLPEGLAVGHARHRRGFMTAPSARPMGNELDPAARRKDGSEFPVEISLAPVATLDGTIVFSTIVDVSARKAAESALAASEHRFRAVLEASPNAVLGINEEGTIFYANPQVETTFGYARDEIVGHHLELILPERVRGRHKAHRTRFMRQSTARPMGIGLDLAGRRRDGTEFPVEISLSPVETEEGHLVFATVADITARKSLENQLLQAQKMESIGRLAGGIAHDFNNMLSAIRGYADLIEGDLRSNTRESIDLDDLGRSAAAITNAAERAAGLTGQLLAFARQQVLQPHVIDLRKVVIGVEPMLQRLIGERIRLALALDPATGRLRGDAAQIDQIIVNLVINARDALPDGGTITVETANHTIGEAYAIEHFDVPPGRYVMLSVGDDGVGMDVETRQHIFEPFFTTKEIGKGTGLGLATIFGIVRQSGGHIWLYSEPGRGTIFKLYFPRVDDVVEQPHEARPITSTHGSGHLLVVEDEGSVRELIVRVLGRAGFTVSTAPDGKAALEILEADHARFAGVVSDVVMPGMTGTELANIVLERFPEIGFLLLSGYTAETLDLADVLTRGAFFLGKPFSADQLARAVSASMRTGRLST